MFSSFIFFFTWIFFLRFLVTDTPWAAQQDYFIYGSGKMDHTLFSASDYSTNSFSGSGGLFE